MDTISYRLTGSLSLLEPRHFSFCVFVLHVSPVDKLFPAAI